MNAPLRNLTLEDKYALSRGRVFLTGTQALVRLLLLQHQRDALAGLNTAGYVSGYRGSPVGGLDQALWKAKTHLQRNQIVFQPGVNEDLAATALWGTQQVNLSPGARHDGVFGMWYGKGPGVDRCGDVFKHANSAGTAKHGGVLVVAGDDHAARSSTVAHQSEHAFKAAMIPVLVPAGVQDYLDLGLHGWAMSRYSGCWVGFKAVADTIESSASVDVSPDRVQIVLPDDYALPAEGLNIRWPDDRVSQEARLLDHKLYAALAYCRANRLNQIVIDAPSSGKPARLGIITTGKSYLDVRQAFDDLGIDDALAAEIGIRLYKIGMVWPLESAGVRRFAEGLEEILVVEEKRQLIEYQLKEELYNWREDVRPRVIGKFDEKGEWALPHGRWLLPAAGELSPAQIARVIAERIGRHFTSPRIRERLAVIDAKERSAAPVIPIARTPYFCPGCPHNTSTRVPAGSRALAGIGCHYMVLWMNRDTTTFCHMGGEGAAWMGQAPFTEQRHVFANLGDGTYFHSGVLAVRAAVAAFNGPIPLTVGGDDGGSPGSKAERKGLTFKVLYNDAVAMTGGQPVDGSLTVPQLAAQLQAEGVHHLVVVTDGTSRAWGPADLPHGVSIRHRDELDAIQREMRECPGVSAIIYDQTCAAEKRRRRKRGKMVDPPRRLFINEAVCEGCGDCGVQSNCLALVPVETEFGRKRAIDQSACNKDYSCEKGFCPSFVSVLGGSMKKGRGLADSGDDAFGVPPAPTLAATTAPYGMLITGVGGTGVVTIGALIGMAAHIDGKGVTVLDMTGLAQKGGAVLCHVRICDDPDAIHAVRIATGEADAVIGGDVIVTASSDALTRMQAGRTRVVVNSAETPTADFTSNPDWQFPLARMQAVVKETVGAGAAHFVDASDLALRLLGDSIASNLFLLGCAWQQGLVPVSAEAIDRAIELNGTAVQMSRAAFLWGRRAAHDPAAVAAHARPDADGAPSDRMPSALRSTSRGTLDDLIDRRVRFLTDYQDAAYAARYRAQVEKVRAAEAVINSSQLTEAVAHNLFKLMAIKDEYEVARLYAETDFLQQIRERFEGDYTLRFHLAPPLLARPDPTTGMVKKIAFGPWMLSAFKWLAKARGLRGSRWDIFGHSKERRLERALLADYEADLAALPATLERTTLGDAIALVSLPEKIRGFGHVKRRNIDAALPERAALRARLGLV